jgi:hypothetical protein
MTEGEIDGTLCEGCGVRLEGEAQGFPRYCSSCEKHNPFVEHKADYEKIACRICKKHVKRIGMPQHLRDVHGVNPEFEENK